ncbi:MAG TPA: fibronectin type III domain-containing protein [Vicinamibacterales bacterium]|nr:fibronectin type III domain-containing protein [Vicinamibacterales bacterium]
MVLCFECAAEAAALTLAWDPAPPGNDVSGYLLSYGTQPGSYPNRVDVGNQTTYQVAGLTDATTYYFVVQAYTSSGVFSDYSQETSGATSGSVVPPSTPSSPTPADAANAIPVTTSVAWATSTNATHYDISFGLTNPPLLAAQNLTSPNYQPGAVLVNGATYYWQVVAKGPGGVTPGPIWRFATAMETPGTPSEPEPADGATEVATTITMTWAASSSATLYDLAFGTVNPPPIVSRDQPGTRYQPAAPLANGTTYYWQIVAKGATGQTAGPIWHFKTKSSQILQSSAVFVGTDVQTLGNWKAVYGSDGYTLAKDGASLPTYGTVTQLDQLTWTWDGSTTDARALLRASGRGRLAAVWYGGRYTLHLNVSDGRIHRIALYVVDWDSEGRSETIEMLDAASGAVLDSRTIEGFAGGQYWIWNVGGDVTIRVTSTNATDAEVSAIFFDPVGQPSGVPSTAPPTVTLTRPVAVPPSNEADFLAPANVRLSATVSAPSRQITSVTFMAGGSPLATVAAAPYRGTWSGVPAGVYPVTARATDDRGVTTTSAPTLVWVDGDDPPASATFVDTDVNTQGNWKGVYGIDGYTLANDTTSLPHYAWVAPSGNAMSWTWADPTDELRALQKASGPGRLAASWYSSYFTVYLVDGLTHQIAIYVADWDTASGKTIQLADARNGTVLDTRVVMASNGGKYLAWRVRGNVTIQVQSTDDSTTAGFAALFFDR